MIIRNANKAAHGFIGFVREMWYNYRQEFAFGLVLSALTFLSFWLGQYIPEHIFEHYINPIECVATVTVCLIGVFFRFRHPINYTCHAPYIPIRGLCVVSAKV